MKRRRSRDEEEDAADYGGGERNSASLLHIHTTYTKNIHMCQRHHSETSKDTHTHTEPNNSATMLIQEAPIHNTNTCGYTYSGRGHYFSRNMRACASYVCRMRKILGRRPQNCCDMRRCVHQLVQNDHRFHIRIIVALVCRRRPYCSCCWH